MSQRPSAPYFICLCLLILSPQARAISSGAYVLSDAYRNGEPYMGIRIHGAVDLPRVSLQGHKLTELSGLAWDKHTQLLYAVSDQGVLFHLKPMFIENNLHQVDIIAAYPLRGMNNQILGKQKIDSEGLSLFYIQGKEGKESALLVSFERQPRIDVYTPQGEYIQNLHLPKRLQQAKNYRSRNKMLEAVVWHPHYGVLTSTERPLRKHTQHQIFDLNNRRWSFQPHSASNSAVVAIELWPDHKDDLLILERAYVAPLYPLIISLRRMTLCRSGKDCPVETIAEFNSGQGWYLDNFEGLSHHHGNHFFMVSDDNNSFLQQTILVYFEIIQ